MNNRLCQMFGRGGRVDHGRPPGVLDIELPRLISCLAIARHVVDVLRRS